MSAGANSAAAVRLENGEIVTREFVSVPKVSRFRKLPVIRGLFIGSGIAQALEAERWAISVQDAKQNWIMNRSTAVVLTAVVTTMAVVFALGPAFVGVWVGHQVGVPSTLVEAFVRISMLVGYVAVIRRNKLIGEMFAYHGAEHKSVATHESGDELIIEYARRFPTAHVRCGTTLLFSVLILASALIVPLSLLPSVLAMALRPLVLFGSVGVACEVQRSCAKHMDRPFARIAMAPGLWLQRLTTNEPTDAQLEVGLCALRMALNPSAVASVNVPSASPAGALAPA